MPSAPWIPTQTNRRLFRGLSILYGDTRGGFLAQHEHDEVQVSVHFAQRADGRCEPVHLHLYPSRQLHAGGWKARSEVIVFQLAPDLLSEVRQEVSTETEVELVPARASRDLVVEGLGLLVRGEYQSRDPQSNLCMESAGYLLARHLLAKHAAFPVSTGRRYSLSEQELASLRRFVRDHIQPGFSVRELASAINTGPVILSQKLRAAVGQSPWRFVQEQRIGHARELLARTRLPIAEVAARLGYTDQSHFTNAFRRWTGVTPKVYRDGSG